MDFIYFWAKDHAWKDDQMNGLGVYKTYFENGGGFTQAFIIAVCAALVLAIIYYVVIGFINKRASTLTVWFIMFALSLGGSFFITDVATGIGSNGKSGISKTQEKIWTDISEDADDDQKAAHKNMIADFHKGLVKATPVMKVCLTNLVITALCYYIFSIIFCLILPASNYAKNHPHKLK